MKKILNLSKLIALTENKFTVAIIMRILCERVENTHVQEKSVCKYFLLLIHCFQKPSMSGLLKLGDVS